MNVISCIHIVYWCFQKKTDFNALASTSTPSCYPNSDSTLTQFFWTILFAVIKQGLKQSFHFILKFCFIISVYRNQGALNFVFTVLRLSLLILLILNWQGSHNSTRVVYKLIIHNYIIHSLLEFQNL